MPRCRPKDYTDKSGDNPNITLIQTEYLILGMPKLSHTERYLRNKSQKTTSNFIVFCGFQQIFKYI